MSEFSEPFRSYMHNHYQWKIDHHRGWWRGDIKFLVVFIVLGLIQIGCFVVLISGDYPWMAIIPGFFIGHATYFSGRTIRSIREHRATERDFRRKLAELDAGV